MPGLRVGSKVIAVKPIGRVPEGTRGVVKVVDGLRWTRYWVAWETGEWKGSIDDSQVVAADGYEEYKRQQADAAERRAAAPAATAEAEAPADGAPAAAGGGRVPEHLLERSRQARARAAAKQSA